MYNAGIDVYKRQSRCFAPDIRRYAMPKDSKEKRKAARAARTAGSACAGALSLALKIVITAILIILTTALLFVCIFAFYVKTTLVDDLDISLEDYSLSESSTVYDLSLIHI